MSYLVHFISVKLPILAGAGILGVSIAGVGAGLIGLAFPLEAEMASAAVGMLTGAWAVFKRAA